MEATTLTHRGHAGLRGPTPLLRLQGDERLVVLTRRGNQAAYEALVARYQSRLLAFCRHMLGSREDAEDVLQEVFAAAFNAMLADQRAINVRPWLYRIARNRCLNHLRKAQAIGVDSMDVHLAENGTTTAEKAHDREEFRLLVADVQQLPETQRTALLLREIDALSYEQIADAMETTVPGVKSLLVRARVSLAEAAEARQITCEEVRLELGEVAEGLKRTSPPVRRHLRTCDRCGAFRTQLRETNRALAALFPLGPILLLKKFMLTHAGATAGGATAAGGAGVAGSAAAGSALSSGLTALATKTAAGLAAAAIVTAGAVEVDHATTPHNRRPLAAVVTAVPAPRPAPFAVAPAARPAAAETEHTRPAKAEEADASETEPQPEAAPGTAEGGVAASDEAVTPATEPQREYDSTTLPQPGSTDPGSGGTVGPDEHPGSSGAQPVTSQPAASTSVPASAPASDSPAAPPSEPPPASEPAAQPAPEPAPEPSPEPAPDPSQEPPARDAATDPATADPAATDPAAGPAAP